MNCEEYSKLTVREKTILVGEAIHSLQNDSQAYNEICKAINRAKKKGVFDGVEIFPTQLAPFDNQKNNEP